MALVVRFPSLGELSLPAGLSPCRPNDRVRLSQASGQSRRDELFGGRRDVESGQATERSAEAKLDEADQYQDKTEEAYKV